MKISTRITTTISELPVLRIMVALKKCDRLLGDRSFQVTGSVRKTTPGPTSKPWQPQFYGAMLAFSLSHQRIAEPPRIPTQPIQGFEHLATYRNCEHVESAQR
jgi:hypothetical protein